jgi:delta24-sterol reductase
MVPPKVSLLKLTQPDAVKKLYEKNHMIQDMLVPFNKFKESLSVFDKETGVSHENIYFQCISFFCVLSVQIHDIVLFQIYPLWLCPFKVENEEGLLNSRKTSDPTKMYVDIGAYGVPTSENFHAKETTRRIESFVRQVNG